VVGKGLADGTGLVTSLVEAHEIRTPSGRWPHESDRFRMAWAGRLVAGKGLETVLAALARLPAEYELAVLGDGPLRRDLESIAASHGVAQRVRWLGHIADRVRYMEELAGSDLFVFPSPAEGFPKVVLDAMAAAVPIVASAAGALGEIGGCAVLLEQGGPAELAAAVARLGLDPPSAARLRAGGVAFASAHTGAAEAAGLVDRWRNRYRHLPWS
jgi:glycosyltransferase involved in cell wall biosynthesis